MSRFNAKTTGTKTTNIVGGEAFSQTPELELISILLTSFAQDQFYRSAEDGFDRLKDLISRCDKKFVAQAAIYARTKFGLRSITHVAASELAKHIGGQSWAKDFYNAIVYRPDDIVEILAYHLSKNGKETNAMRKGFGEAFGKFDAHQLAKYRCENRALTLLGAMKLMHPKPVEKNKEALEALKKGELKSTETWESKLTKAGQEAETEEEKEEFKKDAWTSLIKTKKIGYFALLKNLRNIIEQAPDAINEAMEILTDEKLIKKSLVLPFRYTKAAEEVAKITNGPVVRTVLMAIDKALDISVNNVPKFDGTTLVVLDVSGSMGGRPAEIGRLFAAILVKANNADFMTFDNTARYQNLNLSDTTTTLARSIRFTGGGTNFHSIFHAANRKYDRIIILSDMQGWIGHDTPTSTFNAYKTKYSANPFVYSFDLNSYGTMQFPQQNVFALAGVSEKIFDVMKLVETDKHAMINEIKKITF
jgi:60 kDa SS-A/Ro ribonucleoprotein